MANLLKANQLLISSDANNTLSIGTDNGLMSKDIVIGAGSASQLSFNSTTRELDVTALNITSVHTDAVATDLSTFVTSGYTGTEYQQGDVVILSAATGGTLIYIHNGGTTGTTADFTKIEQPDLTDSYIRSLLSSANAGLTYNATTGVFTTTLDPSTDNLMTITANGLFADNRATASVYDNTTSGLTATTTQAAIDEVASVTYTNGLTKTGSDVELGGTLEHATDIAMASNRITFTDGTDFVVSGITGSVELSSIAGTSTISHLQSTNLLGYGLTGTIDEAVKGTTRSMSVAYSDDPSGNAGAVIGVIDTVDPEYSVLLATTKDSNGSLYANLSSRLSGQTSSGISLNCDNGVANGNISITGVSGSSSIGFTETTITANSTNVSVTSSGTTLISGQTAMQISTPNVYSVTATIGSVLTLQDLTGTVEYTPVSGLVSDASETVKGIAEIATQAETNAGTIDTDIVTPLKLKGYLLQALVEEQFTPANGAGTLTLTNPMLSGFSTPSTYKVTVFKNGQKQEFDATNTGTNTYSVASTTSITITPTATTGDVYSVEYFK
jgi:hypothetical protein